MSLWTAIFHVVFGRRRAADPPPTPRPQADQQPQAPPPPSASEPAPEEAALGRAPDPIVETPISAPPASALDEAHAIPAPIIIRDESFPPPPGELQPITSNALRASLFGAFDFVHEPLANNPENIRILGSWQRDNIVSVPIPQLRKYLGERKPATIAFHKIGAERLQSLWQEWDDLGLLNGLISYDGAFVPRFQRGSTRALSNHAFGSAFDLNWEQNQLGRRPADLGERGCLRELVPIANKHGFYWGGHFRSRPDGMHFELAANA